MICIDEVKVVEDLGNVILLNTKHIHQDKIASSLRFAGLYSETDSEASLTIAFGAIVY